MSDQALDCIGSEFLTREDSSVSDVSQVLQAGHSHRLRPSREAACLQRYVKGKKGGHAMSLDTLRRIDDSRIEVPVDYKQGMRTNGIIYVDRTLEKELEISAIDQVANVATLPGIVGSSIAMPDIHTGYGFTIGGVAAFDLKEGIISPGGVGYDIN